MELEEEVKEEVKPSEMELGLKSLVDKYGVRKLQDSFARIAQKG